MADQIVIRTVKSHVAKLVRLHTHDWLILLLLMVIEAILLIIEPFHRFVGEDMMTEYEESLQRQHCAFLGCPGSFAGLSYLAMYLSGKIRAFYRRGHIAKLCIVLFPNILAALVGISRVDDYWHHWQDIFSGALIGS